ncbi:Mitogen-activated protein kinase kinase kinase 11 [Phytophthora citrophthora]|uniref:Mitogen-activated protein kinase kinase kinase 11 n=1 Tax=Phytophthora citrophthora TaxID=4793 RepID=A0AAD9GIR1_9STRA|nr:Mitogen-activated protein kinase kinase kinase 11 [Phytophthora citrophthora]
MASRLWNDDQIIAVRIPREKVILQGLLSRGGFGEVYAGTFDNERVAVKVLLSDSRKDIRQVESFLTEAKMMAELDHPRIVRLIGVAWDSLTDLCVVLDFVENGDLRTFLEELHDDDHEHGFDPDKLRIAQHVAHGLTYLHSLETPVLHRDLKSRNILLTANMEAKLTDFGISRESSDKTMTAGIGTSLWMAPEVMIGDKYNEKADVYSLGAVLSELDSHTLPYAAARYDDTGRMLSDTAVLQLVAMAKLQVQFSQYCSREMVDLGMACVATDPNMRPSAFEALYKLQQIAKGYAHQLL